MSNSFDKINNLFKQTVKDSTNTVSPLKIDYMKKSGDVTYGIIKEHNSYVIKESKKVGSLKLTDFQYIDNQPSNRRFRINTLQEAIKYLTAYINEKRYVLNVPKPPQAVQQNDMSISKDVPNEVSNDAEATNGMDDMNDADLDMGDSNIEDDANMNDGDESNTTKEIQKLTGKLGQLYNANKDEDATQITVGSLKSLLAQGANKLSDNEKQEVLAKSEKELNDDNENDVDAVETDMNDDNESDNESNIDSLDNDTEEKVEESVIKEADDESFEDRIARVRASLKGNKANDTPTVDNELSNSAIKNSEKLEAKKVYYTELIKDATEYGHKTIAFLHSLQAQSEEDFKSGKYPFDFGWIVEPNKGKYKKLSKNAKGELSISEKLKLGSWTLRVDFIPESITAVIHFDNLIAQAETGIKESYFEIDVHLNNGKTLKGVRKDSTSDTEKLKDKAGQSINRYDDLIKALNETTNYDQINSTIAKYIRAEDDQKNLDRKSSSIVEYDIKDKLNDIISFIKKYKPPVVNHKINEDDIYAEVRDQMLPFLLKYRKEKKELEAKKGRELTKDEDNRIYPHEKGLQIRNAVVNKLNNSTVYRDKAFLSDFDYKFKSINLPLAYNDKTNNDNYNLFEYKKQAELMIAKDSKKTVKDAYLEFFMSFAANDYKKLFEVRKDIEITKFNNRNGQLETMVSNEPNKLNTNLQPIVDKNTNKLTGENKIPKRYKSFAKAMGNSFYSTGNLLIPNLSWDKTKKTDSVRDAFLKICTNWLKGYQDYEKETNEIDMK